MTGICAEEAIRRARLISGLEDFGSGDLISGLEQTTRALQAIRLDLAGRAGADALIVGDLVRRLRIEQWYTCHPRVADQPINGPLLVSGLPRTGTTATVAMLALDPRFRFPRAWEAKDPVPPPRLADEATDPRRLAALKAAESYRIQAIHLSDPDGPDEDLLLLAGLNMRSYHGGYPTPDWYINWWMEDDFSETYAYHARALRLLQSERGPRQWLLKSPAHLPKLDAFFRQYPNAHLIWTHRDPAKVIPSVASLFRSVYAIRGVDPPMADGWIGRRSLRFWEEAMNRALAARAEVGEDRIVDVYNADLVRDPIGTFASIYDRFGWELTPQLRDALRLYNATNAQGAHGEHRYTLEEFGLDHKQVRTAFKNYCERFEV